MTLDLNPYLRFRGQAREAMTFYQAALGGELEIMTFGQMGDQGPLQDQVMHAFLATEAGFQLMASDTPEGMDYTPGNTMSIALSGTDGAALRGYWDALSAGGTVGTELAPQMWGATYGDFTDKFGILWLVNIGEPETEAG